MASIQSQCSPRAQFRSGAFDGDINSLGDSCIKGKICPDSISKSAPLIVDLSVYSLKQHCLSSDLRLC